MRYAILKLHFLAPVHFGTESGHLFDSKNTCLADTFFSALFLEALAYGEETASELYDACQNGRILVSDLLPYKNSTYFLPKPMLRLVKKQIENNSVLKKEFKNMQYISIEHFQKYIDYLKGESDFSAYDEIELLKGISKNESRICAAVKGQEQTEPYEVQCCRFANGSGLYAIVGYENEADLALIEELSALLGYSGIGGRRSSGLGRFESEIVKLDKHDEESLGVLQDLLAKDDSAYQMLISTALPNEEKLDEVLADGYYKVIKRSGFIDGRYAENGLVKKSDLYVLASGSCLKTRFMGDIYDVSRENMHPVYRYAKGLFIGVEI